MFKKRLMPFFLVLLLSAILTGCFNNNLDLDKDVSSIEVYKWDEDTLVETIEDKEFIDKLTKELDKATTGSTANMDFESPDHKLIYKSGADNVFEIGYYKQVMDLDTKGRYWDSDEDLIYAVELELPID